MKTLRDLSDLSTLLTDEECRAIAQRDAQRNVPVQRSGGIVKVRKETGGRKGKTVTVVTGLQHDPATMERIARDLKNHCGAGGTVKEGTIEIQGEQIERVSKKLEEMGYRVR